MKCKRIDLEAEVVKYAEGLGLEDGYEKWADVVTDGWISTDYLIRVTREDGSIVCPYIRHKRGITFIAENDYVIKDVDGTKHVCGENKIFDRYRIIDS